MYNISILNSKNFKKFFILGVFLMMAAVFTPSFAQENGKEAESKKFNPKEVILEHVGDSHSMHVLGKTHIPLPVILYTPKGIETFSSAHLEAEEEGEAPIYKGQYYDYKLDANKIVAVNAMGKADASVKILDF